MHKTWKNKTKDILFSFPLFHANLQNKKKQTKKTMVYIYYDFSPRFSDVLVFSCTIIQFEALKREATENLIMHNQVTYWLDKNRRCVRRCCLKTVIV